MRAFADAIGSGSLANLTTLNIWDNTIGDEGMKSFALAIASGSLPALEKAFVQIGHENHPALVAACKPRGINIEE